MNGYFARAGLCSGTTSVDFGSYSSIDIVCPAAAAGQTMAAARNRPRSARRFSAPRTRLPVEDRLDLPAVVDVVPGEEAGDAGDRQAAELGVTAGALPLPGRKFRQEPEVRAPQRGKEP